MEYQKKKKTAEIFGVPRSTLRNWLKQENSKKFIISRKPVFSIEQEREIANHITIVANMFYGVTTTEMRHLAFDLDEKTGIKHNFNKEIKMAEVDWLRRCLSRHNLSLRKPKLRKALA